MAGLANLYIVAGKELFQLAVPTKTWQTHRTVE